MSEDDWGHDPAFAGALSPLLGALERGWYRLAVDGAERVPAEGGTLLVANHAGRVGVEALLLGRALERPPRFLVDERAFALPWVSVAVRRAGGVPALAANAERLLREGHLVIAEAEPPRGEDRSRYRVGRLADALAALILRTRVPVVPVAVVGAEDGAGLPGPLSMLPLPSRWRIELGEPLDLRSYAEDAATDRSALLDVSERIRERIQSMVYESLVRREGAFL